MKLDRICVTRAKSLRYRVKFLSEILYLMLKNAYAPEN